MKGTTLAAPTSGAGPAARVTPARGAAHWLFVPTILITVAYGLRAASRFREGGSDGYLARFNDDFFYYLVVARNLVEHGRSTFNGLVDTNGYHPLWFLLVSGFVAIAGDPRTVFVIVTGVFIGGCAATFVLAGILAQRYGADRWWAVLTATLTVAFYVFISDGGMETVVAVPAFLGFLVAATDRLTLRGTLNPLLTGLLASVVILCRLDAILFFAILGAALLAVPAGTAARSPRALALVAAGAAPLWVYFAVNRLVFGVWLPISGAAKQLRPFAFPLHPAAVPTSSTTFSGLLALASAVILVALVRLAVRRADLPDARARVLAFATLVFPLVFYAVQSLVSDWRLWPWYFYAWIVAVPVAGGIAGAGWSTRLAQRLPVRAGALVLVVALAAVTAFRAIQPQAEIRSSNATILAFARELASFAQTHPGRYAMGDRAGTVGYLLPEPLLQLEGLMGDKAFLDEIRDRRPLLAALADYKIDYYVTRDPQRVEGCYKLDEPFQAGPLSPHMRDTLCRAPVMVFQSPTDPEGVVQAVFDLRPAAAAAP